MCDIKKIKEIMKYGISHSFEDESIESKVEWYTQMSPNERMRDALEWLEFVRQICKVELPDDRSSFTTVQVLELPRS